MDEAVIGPLAILANIIVVAILIVPFMVIIILTILYLIIKHGFPKIKDNG